MPDPPSNASPRVLPNLNSAAVRPAGPVAPAAATNTPAPAIAEQADRLIKEMSAYIGSANEQ